MEANIMQDNFTPAFSERSEHLDESSAPFIIQIIAE